MTEDVNAQRGQAQSRPSDLQTRFWSGRREQLVYGREREIHKPISGYGVNDAPLSKGANGSKSAVSAESGGRDKLHIKLQAPMRSLKSLISPPSSFKDRFLLYSSVMEATHPDGHTSLSRSHQRTKVPTNRHGPDAFKNGSTRIGLSPNRRRFRVSSGTAKSTARKFLSSSLPGHRQLARQAAG